MKKLLALILALVMTVCVFAACDKKADTKKADTKTEEKELTDEELVTQTMNDFAKYYFAGDEKALEYVHEDAEGYDTIVGAIESQRQLRTNMEDMAKSFGMGEEYTERVEAIGNDFADAVFSNMTITVNEVEIDGDKAVAKCTLTTPDFANFSSLMDGLTDDALAGMTEEEIAALEVEGEAGSEAKIKLIENIFGMAAEQVEENLVSGEVDFNLEKIDGKWLIVK